MNNNTQIHIRAVNLETIAFVMVEPSPDASVPTSIRVSEIEKNQYLTWVNRLSKNAFEYQYRLDSSGRPDRGALKDFATKQARIWEELAKDLSNAVREETKTALENFLYSFSNESGIVIQYGHFLKRLRSKAKLKSPYDEAEVGSTIVVYNKYYHFPFELLYAISRKKIKVNNIPVVGFLGFVFSFIYWKKHERSSAVALRQGETLSTYTSSKLKQDLEEKHGGYDDHLLVQQASSRVLASRAAEGCVTSRDVARYYYKHGGRFQYFVGHHNIQDGISSITSCCNNSFDPADLNEERPVECNELPFVFLNVCTGVNIGAEITQVPFQLHDAFYPKNACGLILTNTKILFPRLQQFVYTFYNQLAPNRAIASVLFYARHELLTSNFDPENRVYGLFYSIFSTDPRSMIN